MKGIDTEGLIVKHIQVNQAMKQRRRTYRAHGRINRECPPAPKHFGVWRRSRAEATALARSLHVQPVPRRGYPCIEGGAGEEGGTSDAPFASSVSRFANSRLCVGEVIHMPLACTYDVCLFCQMCFGQGVLSKSCTGADALCLPNAVLVLQEEPERKLSRKAVAMRRQKIVSGSKSK